MQPISGFGDYGMQDMDMDMGIDKKQTSQVVYRRNDSLNKHERDQWSRDHSNERHANRNRYD